MPPSFELFSLLTSTQIRIQTTLPAWFRSMMIRLCLYLRSECGFCHWAFHVSLLFLAKFLYGDFFDFSKDGNIEWSWPVLSSSGCFCQPALPAGTSWRQRSSYEKILPWNRLDYIIYYGKGKLPQTCRWCRLTVSKAMEEIIPGPFENARVRTSDTRFWR